MKVLQINSVCGYGSTGKIAVDIANALETEGHECLIAYGRGETQNHQYALKIGSTFNVQMHGLLSRITDKHGRFSKRATKKFIYKIKEFNPDVIHLHNIHGYYLHYPTLFTYLKKSNIPVVWTLHDCWSYTGHCAYYTYSGCTKFQHTCEKCPLIKEYPKSYFDNSRNNFLCKQQYFQGLDNLTLVTPSQWLKDEVQKSFLSKYPTKVIYNGIDLNVFKKTSTNKQNEKKIILGVASKWDRRKGLDTFVDLAKILPIDYEIVLIGLNQKQIQSLPHNIVGVERTNSVEELVKYYNQASVFLNPTLEDNYPTTNLEAQACETPVITFRVGGTKETLKAPSTLSIEPNISISELKDIIVNSSFEERTYNKNELSYLESSRQYIELYKEKLYASTTKNI